MSRIIQFEVFALYELEFPVKQSTRIIVIRAIGFANIIIIGFDPTIVEVKDIVM
jgi:hypothetical protein